MYSPYRNAFTGYIGDGCGHTPISDLITPFYTEAAVTWLKGMETLCHSCDSKLEAVPKKNLLL